MSAGYNAVGISQGGLLLRWAPHRPSSQYPRVLQRPGRALPRAHEDPDHLRVPAPGPVRGAGLQGDHPLPAAVRAGQAAHLPGWAEGLQSPDVTLHSSLQAPTSPGSRTWWPWPSTGTTPSMPPNTARVRLIIRAFCRYFHTYLDTVWIF